MAKSIDINETKKKKMFIDHIAKILYIYLLI